MNFEPPNRFWMSQTNKELSRANSRLKSLLLASFIVAAIGWGLAIWGIFQ